MRVLFLTHRLPYPPDRGDRIRAFHIIRTLAPRVELDVVSLVHERAEGERAGALRALGVHVTTLLAPRARNLMRGMVSLASDRPLTHALLDAPGIAATLSRLAHDRPPDVVLAYCSGMARFALESPLARLPLILDLLDVDSLKWRALAGTTSWPKRWIYAREARCLASFERRAALHAHATLVVNEREHAALRSLAPEATIHVLPNGVDVAEFRPKTAPPENARVVFCGVMNYEPNVEAALWFSRNVWPLITARRSDARLRIVGSGPTWAVQRLAMQDPTIEVTGTVPDVRPYLWGAAVSVAPLLTARGVQTKVLEAVAAGVPTVVTRTVLEGLPAEVHPACPVADQPGHFADRVVALLARSGAERREIAHTANVRALGWESQLDPLFDILSDAALGSPSVDAFSTRKSRLGGAPGRAIDTNSTRADLPALLAAHREGGK